MTKAGSGGVTMVIRYNVHDMNIEQLRVVKEERTEGKTEQSFLHSLALRIFIIHLCSWLRK